MILAAIFQSRACMTAKAVDTERVPLCANGTCATHDHAVRACRWLPMRVTGLDEAHVVRVACGWRHSVVVDKQGRIFTFGWSKYGQLGHGSLAYVPLSFLTFSPLLSMRIPCSSYSMHPPSPCSCFGHARLRQGTCPILRSPNIIYHVSLVGSAAARAASASFMPV